MDKPFARRGRVEALSIGFLLACAFPVTAFAGGADLVGTRAGVYALFCSFALSIATYYWFNAERRPRTLRHG
ncbi:hypothetical protein [Flaviaesturariibacter aridisoli]|uniref:Uncharacterized protein n=1 Tax=Flaviaesturariibacter aridisoli TaxID=2545761 RepID=A0A4R4DVD0_9BACT|nr:hypothetical protein [Flaviaesturariibacter aridisoli]TCZ67475.1 hypothetical protein E0486_15460 [Flaviaesturariibacter aridisoli]